jgi:hypothetical protein
VSTTTTRDTRVTQEKKLPALDWVLLPVIGLMTVLFILGSTELIARRIYDTKGSTGLEDCMVLDDPATGAREIPNSVCREKSFESPLVEYRFNSCGDRAGMECGPKKPGSYRIVMVGSSYAIGKRVPIDKTFATLLPKELSQETGRDVELYNRGILMWGTPHVFVLQMNKTLAAQPDLILLALSPWDIDNVSLLRSETGEPDPTGLKWLKTELATGGISGTIKVLSNWSRALVMFKELLYRSQSQYVKSFLLQGEVTDMLKVKPTDQLQSKLDKLDLYIGQIQDRAKAANVPLAVVFIPNRAEAAMIAMGHWPEGYDPYKLGEEIRTIVKRHGGTYIDILPDYREIGNPERGYYPIDGHPNIEGSAMISNMLAKELTKGSIAALKAPPQQTAFHEAQ